MSQFFKNYLNWKQNLSDYTKRNVLKTLENTEFFDSKYVSLTKNFSIPK